MQKSLRLLAALLFISCAAIAQNGKGTIKGFVYDKKSGEPIVSASVIVENAKTGVQTDINGYFSLTLAAGSYTLITTALGYDSNVVSINLLPEALITKKILITQRELMLKEAKVSGRKTEKLTKINTGVTSISPRDLKMLPSAGGEPDLAQYLQVIPGAVFTGDQGGQLFIRGGSPSQTGIYLDGVTIYNPFHSIGLFSVFETEAVRNADVYTAGFGAQYGNRTSAIVDIHTKDGNKNNLSGIVSVSPIMTRALLEGPLVKSKKNDGAGITFLVTAKTSYLDKSSEAFYSKLGESYAAGLPYAFTDAYGKVTFSGGTGSKLNLFGFNFNDQAKLKLDTNTTDFNWKTRGMGGTFVVTPGNSSALIDGKFAYSNYDISLKQLSKPTDTLPRTSSINGFEAAINFTYFLQNYSQLKYGIEVSGLNTDINYYSATGISTTMDRNNTIAAFYALYRHNFSSRVIFEPSIRFQYYSDINKVSPEPRAGLKINISDNVRFKAAAGLYSQNIISTKSDQDIVNLFTGFLLTPDQTIRDADNKPVKSNLQTAMHGVTGVEIDINRVELNVEPWVKRFGQVNELNRYKKQVSDPDFVAAKGIAYGIDLSAKYSYQRVYLWAAVGYQKVTYTSLDVKGEKQTYPTPFDTRLNTNVVAAYTMGKKKDWDVSARFNLHAPFPFTQTQGYYEDVNMVQNGLATDPLSQNGSLNLVYADQINGGRLSYYHRLDLSVRKKFTFSTRTSLDATFAIINTYGRENIFYINRFSNEKIYQLPLFPSLNLTFNF